MSIDTRELNINGRRARVLESGRGKPLLLLHAFPLSADLWRPQLEAPPDGWRIIAPDLKMADGSSPSMDEYAAGVEAVAASLALDNPVVGGLSMGGYVIFALLRRARLSIRALVLADTRAEADTDEGRANRKKMIALAEAEGAAGIAREMVPKLLGQTTTRQRPEVVATVRALIEANSPQAITTALQAMMHRPDSTPLLATIDVPTLVIVGEEDGLTPPPNSESLHRGIRGSRLERVPEAGHLSSLERPDVFNEALDGFLPGL
ncbi:MAG TPA: alpha/beta hydrolase [Vicinamibacterales bacterium]|jgi:pimeloyl-ACP methyl ester carboxylesterase|nr:alpha/beta hydrolase [Vicinamibacterales bacterium]